MSAPSLTFAEAARIMRDATKDKSYQSTPLGMDAARYLRGKRKELTASSFRNYEGRLAAFALHFADLALEDFELPRGAERMEDFMDALWGESAPGTYNVNHSIFADFFDWHLKRQRMKSNPMRLVTRAKKRDVYRTAYSKDQSRAIIASASDRRDRLALRLLLHYGIRKGALQNIQLKHFDYPRRRLTIFTKGAKVRTLILPEPALWTDLERLILDLELEAEDYLMFVRKSVPFGPPDAQGRRQTRVHEFHDRAMSSTALHRWWYARLNDAGITPAGTTRGERMHKARHTAGQRVLDHTGNLKAVQKLLGHVSISTTGDIYTDWDDAQLAASLESTYADESDSDSFPS